MQINILFIGDVVGTPGMNMVETWLPGLKKKYNADLVIVNAENSADGKGCTEKEGSILFNLGVDVITGGNHSWDKRQSQEYMKKNNKVLRPLNYPYGTYGNGYYIAETKKGKVAVLNLQGRAFMPSIDCPFRSAERILKKIKQETKNIFVDFHAETTAEKLALAAYIEKDVSVFVGTHTHIQTADERITANGMAYITDVGMTGPYDSVIGMKTEAAVNRFLYATPQKYQTALDNLHLAGIAAKVDAETGRATEIERIFIPEFDK
jgi:metallophosphoesterase (TIGR00282 family)